MSNTAYRTIEKPSGSGVLRVGSAHLAKVFYHLQVRQEIVADEATLAPADSPARVSIIGELTVSLDEPMQPQVLRRVGSGELLTLHLADGRRLDVCATKRDATSDVFRIVPVGPNGFMSERLT